MKIGHRNMHFLPQPSNIFATNMFCQKKNKHEVAVVGFSTSQQTFASFCFDQDLHY